MTTGELEQAIRDYIMDIYHKEYVGKIKIEKLKPVGYYIELNMNVDYHPIIIYAELNDNAFLKFLKEDLKARRFNLVSYGQLKKEYNYNPVSCDG